jgi:hypothetical protein
LICNVSELWMKVGWVTMREGACDGVRRRTKKWVGVGVGESEWEEVCVW